jgi:hypothetical protein
MQCETCKSWDEWQTCLPDGVLVEPTLESAWAGHYICGNCGNIEKGSN